MATKELHSVLTIDNEDYSLTATKADKVAHSLTVKVGDSETVFDGSEQKSVVINIPTTLPANGGNADTVDNKHASDFILASQKGIASGVATLGTDGKVPASQLPASSQSFSKIAVSGQSTVEADGTADTLTLIAGNNITITTNATNDSITIASTGSGTGTDTNQTVKVGNVTFGVNDSVELVGSGNVTVTGDATNKKITISATDQNTETTLTITDKTNTDNTNLVYAVTNLVEGGTKGHTITPTYTGLPTKTYVDNAVSGFKKITVSQNEPEGAVAGDIWFKY